MNGCGMGDNGRIASLIRSAAAPTVRTDNPRRRARAPKHRSAFENHLVPVAGQQAAAATAIKVAPASMTRSEGPTDTPELETAIMRVISVGPRLEFGNRRQSAAMCSHRSGGMRRERAANLAEDVANATCDL